MQLTKQQVEELVDTYQKLVSDYKVSRLIVGNVVDNNTAGNYFENIVINTPEDDYFESETRSKIVNTYSIIFRKDNESLSLKDAIIKLDLPEPEKLLLKL